MPTFDYSGVRDVFTARVKVGDQWAEEYVDRVSYDPKTSAPIPEVYIESDSGKDYSVYLECAADQLALPKGYAYVMKVKVDGTWADGFLMCGSRTTRRKATGACVRVADNPGLESIQKFQFADYDGVETLDQEVTEDEADRFGVITIGLSIEKEVHVTRLRRTIVAVKSLSRKRADHKDLSHRTKFVDTGDQRRCDRIQTRMVENIGEMKIYYRSLDMIPTDFKAMEAAPMLEPTPPNGIKPRAKKPRRIFRFLGAINPLGCFRPTL